MSHHFNSNILPTLSNLGLREQQPPRQPSVQGLTLPPIQQPQKWDWPYPRLNTQTQSLPTLGSLGLSQQLPPRPLHPRELTLPQIHHPQQWDAPTSPTLDLTTALADPPAPNDPQPRAAGPPPPAAATVGVGLSTPTYPPTQRNPSIVRQPPGRDYGWAVGDAATAEPGQDDQGPVRDAAAAEPGQDDQGPVRDAAAAEPGQDDQPGEPQGPVGDAAVAEPGQDDQGPVRDAAAAEPGQDDQDALDTFHQNKQVFIDHHIRNHFQIPKIHMMEHYVALIRSKGSADSFNTELSEHLHIDCAKEGYCASNKKNCTEQMIKYLTEAVDAFKDFFAWTTEHPTDTSTYANSDLQMSDGLSDHESDWPANIAVPLLSPHSTQWKLTKEPPYPNVSLESLKDMYGAVDIVLGLTTYLISRSLLSPQRLTNQMQKDTIHATPFRHEHRQAIPQHFDTALVHDDLEAEDIGLKDTAVLEGEEFTTHEQQPGGAEAKSAAAHEVLDAVENRFSKQLPALSCNDSCSAETALQNVQAESLAVFFPAVYPQSDIFDLRHMHHRGIFRITDIIKIIRGVSNDIFLVCRKAPFLALKITFMSNVV
ncbi:hypothetical protein JB92DRAFT_3116025 [Gautieria morchelliformis]|nr:hypothetical protein JB92DRAFT_3116025 [Gautieria morchelliformis]